MLGDSHAAIFRHRILQTLPIRFEATAIGGATLIGLPNPNSWSGAGRKFAEQCAWARGERHSPEAVVCMMGEVDCGYLVWRRRQNQGIDVAASLELAVAHYRDVLELARRVAPVIVISAQLPTLVDYSAIGDYAGLRREISADQPARTRVVRQFNERTAELCRELDIRFLGLDAPSLGPDGLVSPLLVNPDSADHHYDPVVYARLLQQSLATVPGLEILRDEPLGFEFVR